jgi:hypothetical protein
MKETGPDETDAQNEKNVNDENPYEYWGIAIVIDFDGDSGIVWRRERDSPTCFDKLLISLLKNARETCLARTWLEKSTV